MSISVQKWHRSWSDRLLTVYLVVLALAPFHLGSNRQLSGAALAFAIGALCVAVAVTHLAGRNSKKTPLSIVFVMVLVAGAAAWAWGQTQSWVPAQWHNPVWQLLEGHDGAQRSAITVDLVAPMDALLQLVATVGAFWLSFLLCRRQHRARRLLLGVVFIAAAYALIGFVIALTKWKLWADLENFGVVTSTFPNRNHYATYANIGIAVALGLLFGRRDDANQNFVPARVLWFRKFLRPLEETPFRLIALSVGFVALLGTQSRGGFLSLVSAVMLLFVLKRLKTGFSGRQAITATFSYFAILGIVVGLVGQPLLSRFDDISSSADIEGGGRISAYTRTVELIGQKPFVGYGLGTYDRMFLMNTDERFAKHFHHAHNDYLELAAGVGVPVALALLVAIAVIFIRCARLFAHANSHYRRFALCGLLTAVVVGVHALVDFSLTIPAVALTFAAVMGAACAGSVDSRTN